MRDNITETVIEYGYISNTACTKMCKNEKKENEKEKKKLSRTVYKTIPPMSLPED